MSATAQPAATLLGGPSVLGCRLTDPLETHDLLRRGLPARAIDHLLSHLLVLDKTESLALAMGMSLRTFQRRQDNLSKPLNAEQSGRTWKFAEILAQAIRVFGTQEAAERWLDRPTMGLNGRRPIDLLATPVGVAMVETFLTRLEHGVYT